MRTPPGNRTPDEGAATETIKASKATEATEASEATAAAEATVTAARAGDPRALDALAAAYLPLVYNIVGRAMSGHPDVDDVVQETMLRAIRHLGELRDPAAFRSWIVAIAVRQVSDSYQDRLARPPAVDRDVPGPDFADETIERLGLSGQRRQTAEATRWLDDDDRPLLALWWQEASGHLTRADLAAGLGLTTAHAAVQVARMKERLLTARVVVHALQRFPQCRAVTVITADWDGTPSPLWRKRLARHVRDCPQCRTSADEMIPAERLLGGLPLLAVPARLAAPARLAGRTLARTPKAPKARLGRHTRHTRTLTHSAPAAPKLAAVSLAVLTAAAGGTFAIAHARAHRPPPASASASAPAPAAPAPVAAAAAAEAPPVPLVTQVASVKQAAAATSARKGVAAWNFTGVHTALAVSGASWYYNWGTTPSGITAPERVHYVPMIWGANSVTTANLAEVRHESHILLGFNEPDMSGQANLSVAQALALWPKLMATGMTLGSPAVATDAATKGGWLDQFMTGAKARGYRVNFITVHWYGGDFRTAPAVSELKSYLQAIYARYRKPIWLTEFALTSYAGGRATFPTEAAQAAFLTKATKMLDHLTYVQRYAWFALPTSAGSGTTGLFSPGPKVTEVGRAFEAAR